MHKEITGLILSGGEGSRMGGVNKGLLPYCESTLIEHCILRLKGQVEKIVINANKDIFPKEERQTPTKTTLHIVTKFGKNIIG